MTQHCTQDERLLDYLYEEMSAQEAEAFSTHVESCAHCRAELQQLRGVRTAFHDLPAPEPRPEALQRMTAQLLHQAAQSRRGGSGHDEAQSDEAGGAAAGGVLGKLLPFRRRPLMKMLLHPASGLLVAAAATLTLVVVSRDWQKNLAPIHQPVAMAPAPQAPAATPVAPVVPAPQTAAPEPPAQKEAAQKDETAVTGAIEGMAKSEKKTLGPMGKGGAPQWQVLDADKVSTRLRASAPAKAKQAPQQDPDSLWKGDVAASTGGARGPAPAQAYAKDAPPPAPPPPGMPAPADSPASEERYAQQPPPEAQQQAAGGGGQVALAPLPAQAAQAQMPSQAPAVSAVPREYPAHTDGNGLKLAQQAPVGSMSGGGRGQANRGYSDDGKDAEVLQQQTRNQQRADLNRAVSRPAMPAVLSQSDSGPLRDQFHKLLKLGQCQQAAEMLRRLENRFPSSPDDAVHVEQYQKACGARPGTEIAQPQAAPMRRQMPKPAKKMREMDRAASDEQNAAQGAAPAATPDQNQNQSPAQDNAKK